MNSKVHFNSNNFKSKLVPSQTLCTDLPHHLEQYVQLQKPVLDRN